MESICGSDPLNLAARNNGVQPSTTDVTVSKPCLSKNRPKAESVASGGANSGDPWQGDGGHGLTTEAAWLCAEGCGVCAGWSAGGVGWLVGAIGAASMLRQSATRCYLMLPHATHCSQCVTYQVPPTNCLSAASRNAAEVLPKCYLLPECYHFLSAAATLPKRNPNVLPM